MNNSTVEPLRPATLDEVKRLIEIYEQNLPQNVQFVMLLQNILRTTVTLRGSDLLEASHRFRKTVYVPNEEKFDQFATFVAISLEQDQFIMLHTLQNPPSELSNALRNTNHIKWDHKPTFVVGGDNGIRESLYHIATERSLPIDIISDCLNYWMPREKAAILNYDVPDDVELKPLQVEHGKQLDEWWPFRYKTSQWYFESAIRHNGALGLFEKKCGRLVACVFKNDHDGIGHLYTIPECNNKGYGTTLAKAITRMIAVDHKQHAHTFIGPTNIRSKRLFEKLGYTLVNRTKWYTIG